MAGTAASKMAAVPQPPAEQDAQITGLPQGA